MPQSSQRSPQPTTNAANSGTQGPVEKFRDGPVHVSIWENDGTKGAFRAASFELRYKDGEDQWQTGKSYTSNALLHLESAAREARSRIERWQESNIPRAAPRR
jgi:hypothetical protein